MNINVKFFVFCVNKCLHLWNPPKEILIWLDDPENGEKAKLAWESMIATNTKVDSPMGTWAASTAILATAIITALKQKKTTVIPWSAVGPAQASLITTYTSKALNITENEIKLDFVSKLTEEELSITDPYWIEYINVEIFSR